MVEPAITNKLTSHTHFLVELSQRIAADPSPEIAVPQLLNGIQQISTADVVRLVLEGNTFETGTSVEADIDAAIHTYVVKHGALALGTVKQQGLPLPGGIVQIMAEPLYVRGALVGTLWMGFEQESTLDESILDLIRALGIQAAVLIESTQSNEVAESHRQQLLSILDSMMDAVVLVDSQLRIQAINAAAESLLNVSAKQAQGKQVQEFIPQQQVIEALQTREDAPVRVMLDLSERNYQAVICDVAASGHLLMLTDISHYKRLNENMTLFLQTVSHDLRSPLTAAKGFVDMMSMVGQLNDKQLMMQEKILTSIVDMTNLVEKVLDAGRLDPQMGAYEMRREPTDLVLVVEKVVSTLMPAAQKKNLSLQAKVVPNLPLMNLDELMIERSLVNLVENAVKYTPAGGSITVSASVDQSNLVLAVQDNGLGIPTDKVETVFLRGSRIRREEFKQIRGSGLGLFIVKSVAQQHGGDAVVESAEGQGSMFKIIIPIAGQNMLGASNVK